jgi:heat shock protein HtpX
MTQFKRWSLFIITNLLIMVTFGIAATFLIRALKLDMYAPNLPSLLIFCGVFGMAGSFFSLFISKWMAKTMYGVKIIDSQNLNPELYQMADAATLRRLVSRVHSFAQRAQLSKMPEVGIYDSADPNAFATGPSKSNSLVAVSTGLLSTMSEAEVDGVLAHEVAHIANGDMVTMALLQGIVNTFAMFFSRILASIAANSVDENKKHMVYFIATIIGDILFTLLGSFVVAYFSRRREFRADRGSAEIGSKQNMVAALQKLQMLTNHPRMQMAEATQDGKDAMAAMKISSGRRGGILALMSTHPPLEERIAALQRPF